MRLSNSDSSAPTHHQELLEACRRFNLQPGSADAASLAALLAVIEHKAVPRAQIPSLLAQAYQRLATLRQTITAAPELVPALEQIHSALSAGDQFSLPRATEAFASAQSQCQDQHAVAWMLAGQAQLAALSCEHRRAAELWAQAAATPGLTAAEQWHYQLERATALQDQGRDFMDNSALDEAVVLLETTVLPLVARDQRPLDWARTQNRLGVILGILGRRQRGTVRLEQAVAAFDDALASCEREQMPLDWAEIHNNLGNALGVLGQRQGEMALLERAIAAFEQALMVRQPATTATAWAQTQHNLGAALLALGQRKQDAALLARAVDAFNNTLTIWGRDQVPLDWANAMDNIGTAWRLLGELQHDARMLEQAIAAYRNALTERTHDRVPQDWALSNNNLGAALHKLGEREHNADFLAQAVAAYQHALSEWTRERGFLTWAMTQANLGVARRLLAAQTKDVEIARQAVSDLDAVREAFRAASHAHYYELADEQVNQALATLASLSH